MLDRFRDMLQKGKVSGRTKIRHAAITMDGISDWARLRSKTPEEAAEISFDKLTCIIEALINEKVPVISFNVIRVYRKQDDDFFKAMANAFSGWIGTMTDGGLAQNNRIRVSVLGKWYDYPPETVDAIRRAIAKTKDHDSFFLNLCLHYDGQVEIVDSCRLIAMQVKAGKADPESVSKDSIRQNLYSSSFMPPDVIIITGGRKRLGAFLLWDSVSASLAFIDKLWPEIDPKDVVWAMQETERSESGQ